MKRLLPLLLALMLLITPFQSLAADAQADYSDKKVVLLIPGNLGDQSFFDLTVGCVPLIKEAYNIDVKVVEMGTDAATWLPSLQDYGDLGYDIIMCLTGADEQIDQAARQYPDSIFLNVCGQSNNGLPNLATMNSLANEMSYFGGVCAALKAQELGEDTIGFVGGMDILGINYFLVGYIEGAQWVNPDIKVVPSYVGSFTDPSTAKENALLLYNYGVSVIYAAAGGSGLGVMDAAANLGKYVIGVDIDQYAQLKDSSPELAATIIASCVQQIPQYTCAAVGKVLDGTQAYGGHVYLGIADNAVGLAKTENLYKLLSAESIARLDALEQEFSEGELPHTQLVFEDGSSLDADGIKPIIDSARP